MQLAALFQAGHQNHPLRMMTGTDADGIINAVPRPVRTKRVDPLGPYEGGVGVTQETYGRETEATGWTGWIAFAGVMMIIGGSLATIFGFVAAVNDDWVVFTNRNAVSIDLSAWGWLHVVVGIIVLLSGLGLFTGNVLARIVAVIVASVSLIANFLWLPVYPIWAIIVITIDALVIWAVTAHGGEVREL